MRRILFVPFIVLCGCAHTRAAMKDMLNPQAKWVGKPEADLVSSLGAPNLTAQLANGRRVLTWITAGTTSVTTSYVPGVAGQVQSSECRMSFTVDSTATVRSYSQHGC